MATVTWAVTRKKKTLLIITEALLYLSGSQWILWTVKFWTYFYCKTMRRTQNEAKQMKLMGSNCRKCCGGHLADHAAPLECQSTELKNHMLVHGLASVGAFKRKTSHVPFQSKPNKIAGHEISQLQREKGTVVRDRNYAFWVAWE